MRTFQVVMWVGVVLVWAAMAGADSPEVDHAGAHHVVIGVAPDRLIPTVQEVKEGEAFAWLNYSSRSLSIAFDADVAKHLTCMSPSPFELAGKEFLAHRIPSGGFAALCRLTPGEYDYRVVPLGPEGASGRVLLGKLVVR